jgi:hypothetical protein
MSGKIDLFSVPVGYPSISSGDNMVKLDILRKLKYLQDI